MNVIQVSLASLVMFGGVFVARPGYADHLRHPENLAHTLHQQTIDYARWLRYHVPHSGLRPQLEQDAAAVLTGVNHLQQLMLFNDGSPGDVRRLRGEVRELDRLVTDVHRRVKESVEADRRRDRFGGFDYRDRWDRPGGVQFRFGEGFSIAFPEPDHRHPERHRDRDDHRLRDGLRGLESRLETVHRTVHELDEALRRVRR